VTGTVNFEDGKLLKGAVVRAVQGLKQPGEVVSNDKGEYAIELSPGRYLLEVLADGCAYAFAWKECWRSVRVDFRLSRGRAIHGVALDSTGSTVPGVEVVAERNVPFFPVSGGYMIRPTSVATSLSDAEGRFVFEHLGDDEYEIHATAEGWGSVGMHSFVINGPSQPGLLAVHVTRGVVLRGAVRSPQGRPVEGAEILFCQPGSPHGVPSGRGWRLTGKQKTDAKGEFSVTAVIFQPGLEYRLLAYHPTNGKSSERVLRVRPGTVVEGQDLEFGRGRCSVTGIITGREGKPVHDAKVWIDTVARSVTTDKEGSYSISKLERGTYQVIVQAEGYTEGKSEAFVLDDPSNVAQVNIELLAAVSIHGKVTDAAGRPLSDGIVWAIPAPANERSFNFPYRSRALPETVTDKGGAFDLSPLSASARYMVCVLVDGFALRLESPVSPVDVPLTLTVDKEACIAGRVINKETGRPVVGTQVSLRTPFEKGRLRSRERRSLTDDKGRFEFISLPSPAKYIVTAGVNWQLRLGERRKISLQKGERMEDISLEGSPPLVLKGTVREKGTGRPVANAMLQSAWGGRLGLSDQKGEFRICGVQSDELWAYFGPLVSERRLRIPVDAERGGVVENLIIELTGGKMIKGRVTDTLGNALEGVAITPFWPRMELDGMTYGGRNSEYSAYVIALEKRVVSDSKGSFEISGIPLDVKVVTLSAWHPGYSTGTAKVRLGLERKDAAVQIRLE